MDAAKESLELKMDSKERVSVRGLRDVTVPTLEHAMLVLEQGRLNRQVKVFISLLCLLTEPKHTKVAETKLNTDSSRSHSVFTIKLCTVPKEHVVPYEQVKENPGRYVRYTKLSIIDLVNQTARKKNFRCFH